MREDGKPESTEKPENQTPFIQFHPSGKLVVLSHWRRHWGTVATLVAGDRCHRCIPGQQ